MSSKSNTVGNGNGVSASKAAERVVLIVEDHELTARSLSLLLTQSGIQTQVAQNAGDALERCAAGASLTAVLIDVHLPDMNGLVLTQKLRERLGPDVPIIVLSGDTSMETIKSLPHVGASYFISKPVQAAQLRELVNNDFVIKPCA